MTTTANHFMNEYFNHLPLRPTLFYSSKYGIRFEISMSRGEHKDIKNLQQIMERNTGIFNHVFQDADELLLITNIHCKKNDTFLQKRPTNVYQKCVKNKALLKKLQHIVLPNVFSEGDVDYEDMVTHRILLSCKKR